MIAATIPLSPVLAEPTMQCRCCTRLQPMGTHANDPLTIAAVGTMLTRLEKEIHTSRRNRRGCYCRQRQRAALCIEQPVHELIEHLQVRKSGHWCFDSHASCSPCRSPRRGSDIAMPFSARSEEHTSELQSLMRK